MRGFTLWEMLMVLILMGVVIMMAIPSLEHFSIRQRSNLLQTQLMHIVTLANQEAHAQHATITLHITDKALYLFKAKVDSKSQIIFTQPIKPLHGKLHWRSYPVYRSDLVFDPSRPMQNDNGTFWYCLAKDTYPVWAIVVNKAARAYVVHESPALTHFACT